MVDETTAITTTQLRGLVGMTAQYLGQLESENLIKRTGRNTWPLVTTVRAIVDHLRAANRRGAGSEADKRWKEARARELEIRTAAREHRLVPTDIYESVLRTTLYSMVAHLVAVPARCTNDLALRRKIEIEIDVARAATADEIRRQAEALEETGRAL